MNIRIEALTHTTPAIKFKMLDLRLSLQKSVWLLFTFIALPFLLGAPEVFAGDAASVTEALSKGKVSADFRYRYEMVDDSGPNTTTRKNAQASTLRSRLGYQTASFKGVSGFLEFEDVSVIGNAQYNSTANGKTAYPVVADPEDTEVNQAYLKYTGLAGLTLIGGRQRIKLDNDRFIGNVGWRQNEQTFDAVRLAFGPMADLVGTYLYLANVNRIFGEHNPNAVLADSRMDSHLLHLGWIGQAALQVSAYGYLLDFEGAPAASTQTFGIRFTGTLKPGETLTLLYTAEYADQSDYAQGAAINQGDYYLIELGAGVMGISLQASYELLSGDGVYGFATPLATAHAFQGWADKFLATPAGGVEDLYFTLSGKALGLKLVGVYHFFNSDAGNFKYGTETDLLIVKPVSENTLISVKYAMYEADRNPQNTGGPAVDTDKLWLTGELKF